MASTFESPVGIDPKKTSLNSSSPTPEMLQYDAPLQDMQLDDAQTVLLSLSGYEDANGFWYCHNCPISHLDEAQYTAPVDGDELNTFDPLTDMLGSKLCDLDSFEEKASPSDGISTLCQFQGNDSVLEADTPEIVIVQQGDACYDIVRIQENKSGRNLGEIADIGIDPAALHYSWKECN
ncbi:hypothetical protein AU210_016429 [Fusarium oxysporum f. sp. radicis-cucumerinum]|uniref:Uncharacterized protein n=1 Tax=Fusarium oxysporum f. sp. radicis-cucumerinum TaxID=327505 RepID=A0A2H3FPD3_FUSOX|nr:hypothetical protein AU210_016429 [Fusarium oxysporum f. sp. radicis-cucumerinum]